MTKATVTAKPGEATVTIERVFHATPDKVFKAMTTKELVEKWWVGPGYETTVEVLEPTDGGTWKYVQHAPDGRSFGFHGVFHIVSPELTIQTFEFDGMPERGHVSLDTMRLIDQGDGTTKMMIVSAYQSVEDRDGMLQSGMEEGMNNTYQTLDGLVQSL